MRQGGVAQPTTQVLKVHRSLQIGLEHLGEHRLGRGTGLTVRQAGVQVGLILRAKIELAANPCEFGGA